MERKPVSVVAVTAQQGSGYPPPHDEPCRERIRRRLGDIFGLTDFGINQVTLTPGVWSSQRHWHTHEDEFIYVLEGEPTLVTDDGEQVLGPGMCMGFPSGDGNGHHLINRSDRPVTYLEIGSRNAQDDGHYPDIDLEILKRATGGVFTRRGGYPLHSEET